MCAIVDANVANEVFSSNDSFGAGVKFFNWINTGIGRFVTGGKLLDEQHLHTSAWRWIVEARRAGKAKIIEMERANLLADQLKNENCCESDDQHIIALAQISGARLLYSNDRTLHKDFKNKKLIDNPRGKIYSTTRCRHFNDSHNRMLKDENLCKASV